MERPKIKGKLLEVVSVFVSVGIINPFVITLEDVTLNPPNSTPLLRDEVSDEVAADAAVEELEVPPVGSTTPFMSTELFLTVLMVMKSTLS